MSDSNVKDLIRAEIVNLINETKNSLKDVKKFAIHDALVLTIWPIKISSPIEII